MKVWDLPVRLFHWAIVLLILAAWVSAGRQPHGRCICGLATCILALLLFRMVLGLHRQRHRAVRAVSCGARSAALRHLADMRRREPDREIGHNAAGGWMVLLMLALLGVQAGTGLFSNDDGDTEGPLMHLVSKGRSDWLSHIHCAEFQAIEAVIVLHVLAIVAYAVLKRQNLVRPMVTGRKLMPDEAVAPRMVNPVWAVLVLAAALGVVVWVTRL